MLTIILFIIGFLLLIKGADMLVDGSSSLARKYHISDMVIGLTIVAFGTSAPELIVNIFASINGNTDIVLGNILGSNIANILLILGICALITKLPAQTNTVYKEIPFSFLAAALVLFMGLDTFFDKLPLNMLGRIDGMILIAFFIIFLYYTFGIAKSAEVNSEGSNKELEVANKLNLKKSALYIIIGLTGLVIGGKWIVDGAIEISRYIGLSEAVISLTVVAIGTSLPELATSAVAAYRKQADIAIGNIVGSNIFNIFWILGISAVINPLTFDNNVLIDAGVTMFATFLLFFVMFIGEKKVIQKWQGGLLLFSYIVYVAYLIILRG